MNDYIKVAMYNDETYGLISEFITRGDQIIFAYTKVFNNKYTYMLVSDKVNELLIKRYLCNE